MMHPTATSIASPSLPSVDQGSLRNRRSDDMTYQAVTVAAILLVLGSLWIF